MPAERLLLGKGGRLALCIQPSVRALSIACMQPTLSGRSAAASVRADPEAEYTLLPRHLCLIPRKPSKPF